MEVADPDKNIETNLPFLYRFLFTKDLCTAILPYEASKNFQVCEPIKLPNTTKTKLKKNSNCV